MKTNQEFLLGIYEKAVVLQEKADDEKIIDLSKLDNTNRQKPIYKILYSVGGLAAAVCIVAAVSRSASTPMFPQVQPANQGLQRGAIGFEIEQHGLPIDIIDENIALSEIASPFDIAKECDIVVLAEVKKIDRSVSEKENIITDVTFRVIENIKGELSGRFKLAVNGGYIKKTETFSPYQAYFVKGDTVLLFLNKSSNDENRYTLSTDKSSKYTYSHEENEDSIYSSEDGNTISMTDIKNAFIMNK